MGRLVLICVVLGMCGCAGLAQDALRRDVTTVTMCDRVVIEGWSGGVSRVDACGESLVCYFERAPGTDATDQLAGIGGHWRCKPAR